MIARTCELILAIAGISVAKQAFQDGRNQCEDRASCQLRSEDLIQQLAETSEQLGQKLATVRVLERLRASTLSGTRTEMPSVLRRHLEEQSSLAGEMSFNQRHRPVSADGAQHFSLQRVALADVEVRLHSLFWATRKGDRSSGTPALLLLLAVDTSSRLWVADSGGGRLLIESFDLRHPHGSSVTQLALCHLRDRTLALTADDVGSVRVHDVVVDGNLAAATVSLSCNFSLSPPADGAPSLTDGAPLGALESRRRRPSAAAIVDRGPHLLLVLGDTQGGISVFLPNGTLRGRVQVSRDLGGVLGLRRAQGQNLLFFSSDSFGFFSAVQTELVRPACRGWGAQVVDVIPDPTSSDGSRVLLALSDGDVLVYATSRGKKGACDLVLKFPRVSRLPLRLHFFRGHIMGLPTLQGTTIGRAVGSRELFFFNIDAMEAGYSLEKSDSITLQASFYPREPLNVVFPLARPVRIGRFAGESLVAIQFVNSSGIDMYDLKLDPPRRQQAPSQETSSSFGAQLRSLIGEDWMAGRVVVFGIMLIIAGFWGFRRVRRHSGPGRAAANDLLDFGARMDQHRRKRNAAPVDAVGRQQLDAHWEHRESISARAEGETLAVATESSAAILRAACEGERAAAAPAVPESAARKENAEEPEVATAVRRTCAKRPSERDDE